ncbi:MAG: GxxExxY protein [Victivallaceae bacterium]|jgi:GxxExxY protein
MNSQNDTKRIEEENLFRDECYIIQGAIFEVYRNLGCGFLEAVYQESLEHEFNLKQIPFVSQKELELRYKGIRLKQTYKPDFICYGKIIVELKALSDLSGEHDAQLLNYLKATNLRLGLLVNFGHYPKVQIKRMIT